MFDVIVLGSGLGGLISAAILTKEGKRVLVLEKNNQLGGNLQCFVRDKTIFDTGVHYIGGLLPGQNLHTYFQYLGIMDDLQVERMDMQAFDTIHFGDDPQSYPYAQGKQNYIQQLAVFFPEEASQIEAFVNRMEDCCNRFPLFQVDPETAYSIYAEDLEKTAHQVVQSYIKNPRLQAVLLGSQLLYAGEYDKTPFYVHALSVYSYIQSAWKCTLGGSQIAKLLARKIRQQGGEILKYEEVKDIHVDENGFAQWVKTQSGKTFHATHFISNIHPKETIRMISGYKLRKNYQQRILSSTETISSFSLFLVLKPGKIPYRSGNIYFCDHIESLAHVSSAQWPKYYMLSMTASKKNPEWAESITVFTYMDFQEVEEWQNSKNTIAEQEARPASYLAFKEQKAKIFFKKIEKVIPGVESNTDKYYTATPLSYRDYIGNQKGELYGFIKNVNEPLRNFNPALTKVRNLYQTGQHQNMHGILGVTISAVMTCSEMLGKSYLLNRISASRQNPLEEHSE